MSALRRASSLLALALLPAAVCTEEAGSRGSGTTSPAGTGGAAVAQKLAGIQAMLESLEDSLSAMSSCCNCSGGGGGTGDKSGKGFNRPTTTFPNGPVSAGGAPTTTTTTTTIGPKGATSGTSIGAKALCAAFGDPHFITFDGGHTVFVGQRTVWMVKTDSVWIQALAKGSDGKLLGLAVGGSFFRGHTLIVYNETKKSQLEVVFDGQPILSSQVDKFHEPGVLDAQRDVQWDPDRHSDKILDMRTEAKFDVGPWRDRFLGQPKGGLLLLKLPNDIEMTITGVDFMSVVITMPRPDGAHRQGGYCGNMNGDPEDDAKPVVPSWNVPIGEDLGRVKSGLNLFKGKSAPATLAQTAALLEAAEPELSGPPGGELKRLLGAVERCPDHLRREARQRCSGVQDARIERDCIFDVCVTKDAGAAADAMAAEILEEEVNARGIPVFMGHGRCTDVKGRHFDAFETRVRTDKACQDVLRSLALVKGVLGAQLHRTSSCQILVERGTDPTAKAIPGGWVSSEARAEPGRGLVSGVERDAGWSCWQLD